MTQPPDDQPAIWLKQVPVTNSGKPGVWSQALIPGHRPVRRSAERPKETADGPTLSRLLLALDGLHPQGRDLPADTELLEVMRAYDDFRSFEVSGKDS